MSDPTLEEESLISQDDIDKLLNASSLEEAEESLDAPAEEVPMDMDEMGELSQDDIDSLLSGSDDDEGEEPEEAGELSQDDIDSLLGGGSDAEEDEGAELSQDDIDSLMGGGPEEDDAGELSQNDIDSLLGGGDNDDDDDTELISQDDIDSLMSGDDQASDEDDDELISMDDIQDMIGGDQPQSPAPDAPESDEPPEEVNAPESVEGNDDPPLEAAIDVPESIDGKESQDLYDEPIDEADAMEVSNCLITQETMDELIRNAQAADVDAEPAPELDIPEADSVAIADEDPDAPIDLGDDAVDIGISDDDLDGLLDEAGGDVDLDIDAGEDGDVTQEDIDALLQESDDGDDFLDEDDDILISQDDIDTLLMAADQEDEDVLGDLLGDDAGDAMDDFEEHELISGALEDASEMDQVVLEDEEPDSDEDAGQNSERMEKIQALLKSKLVLAAASVLLVLGISVPGVYFLFFSGKPVALPEKEAVPTASMTPSRNVSVASVSVEEEPLPVLRQSGTIVLADFVILSSDQEKDMTYIYADISIDYSDQRAYHEISNNLSFYRDLIYEAIQTSLVSEKRNQVTESDLLWGVETSLKKVLPPHFIEKIGFKTFRTS